MDTVGSLPSRPSALLMMIPGSSTIITMRKTTERHKQTRILNRVCRMAHAAEMIAPQGPPAAVPAAISATALPPSTPAFTVAAAALAVASAPFFAACFAACFPAFLAAFAAWPAAWPMLSEPSPICCFCGSAILSPPYSNCQRQTYFLFYNRKTAEPNPLLRSGCPPFIVSVLAT